MIMNEEEIKKLWQESNAKLDPDNSIDYKQVEESNLRNVQKLVSSMKPIKIFAILIGSIWGGLGIIILGSLYLNAFSVINKYFLFSATGQIGLTVLAIALYFYQIIMIYSVDITDPVVKTQLKLARLKSTTIWAARIAFLQLPLWTTFYWNETMFRDWNWLQWTVQGAVTFAFAFAAFWLFFNLKYENKDKRWFKRIFSGEEWNPLISSIELIKQLDDYELSAKKGPGGKNI